MRDHMISFKAELDEEGERELFARWARLREIPEVVELVVGKNVGSRARGFDYCMRITFESEDGLRAYEEHPLHQDVRTYNRSVSIEHICFDFEWDAK